MGKGRAPCCDKSQVKRGPWSPAEDLSLIAFIQKHGHENWRALPKQAGQKSPLSLSLLDHGEYSSCILKYRSHCLSYMIIPFC